ncbi:hypothetical protein D9613_004188 [Agrocybe pediades]|uniref:Exosome complex protein n=1 Tax=Agrocybe pediades TaxID=84607 RepID=A0A8H4QIV0_9AGAR|nr:hypothetical protein D9613_004188 [Agrocybe pediades]
MNGMNAETTKLKNKLAALSASFDELESLLEPLLAQPLPETIVDLEPLQQAKLQTALPYVVYDLIFIYLKSRGIDPKTHPVISELDRIRQYFEKINHAENPPAKKTEIDKAAASRFIKHAIAQSQSQWKKTAAEEAQDADNDSSSKASGSNARVPVKQTQKMIDRAAYEQELKSRRADEDEEDDLEVFEGGGDENAMDVDDSPSTNEKGKGKEPSTSTPEVEYATANKYKRRRAPVDPFAGYDGDAANRDPSDGSSKKSKPSDPSPPSSTPQTPTGEIPEGTSTKSKSTSKKDKKKKAKKAS